MSAEFHPRYARACLALAACAVMALVAAVIVAACSKPSQDAVADVVHAVDVADAGAHMENVYGAQTYGLDASDLLSIAETPDIAAVNLSGGTPLDPATIDTSDVRAAISAIEQTGDCGFVFVDVGNGHGFVYNAGEVMYIASAAKAPFVSFLLQSGFELSSQEQTEVGWTITESDNDSFEDLYMRYVDEGYPRWMTQFDVQHDDYYGDFYPKMSARSLAAIWADILLYMRSGTPDAQWLADLTSATETSFIRDGLYGTDAVVMNKGGWIFEEGSRDENVDGLQHDSVTDAGIIEAGGRTYLMAIVTSQPDSGTSEANVSVLARALFDLRSAL